MTTVAAIAAKAFSAVADRITDAIQAATLTATTQGAYNAATGAYATTTSTQTGRAVVDTVTPKADIFPDYTAGTGDELILLEGFTACTENMVLTMAGGDWHVSQVQDILRAGSLFYIIARRK